MAESEETTPEETVSKTKQIHDAFAPINFSDRSATVQQYSSSVPKSDKKHRTSLKRIILLIGFLVLVAILGLMFYNFLNGSGEEVNRLI